MVQGVVIEDGYFLNTNPATGEVIAKVKCSTTDEVVAAVARAKAAQVGWAAMPLADRIVVLKIAIMKLKEVKDEAVAMCVKEMGKVVSEAEEECEGSCDRGGYLDLIAKANETVHNGNGVVVREALGVVAVCSPWNFPIDEPLLLALPALAAGNAVVLKPSEVVPLCGELVAKALQAALPPGVLELVQGDGAVGAALVSADGVNMCAMTGSSATGSKIMASCAGELKRLVLELGGKDPMVVFADADLDKAAEDAVAFSLYNAGQVCCSVERVYVDQSVLPEFEKKCVALALTFAAGDPGTQEAKIGPMVSKMQRDNVQRQVDDAVSRGAKLLCQAPLLKEGGNFYPATVLSGLKQSMPIQHDETFGPVVALAGFDGSEAEAVKLANDTVYGLAAYVYTQDMKKAQRVAMGIKAGQVGINAWSLAVAPQDCPWVGHKKSGFGYHSGPDGWRQFSVPKSLIFLSETDIPN